MNALPNVVRAEYRGEFKIRLVFDDGVDGTVDFAQWLTETLHQEAKSAEAA